VVDGTSPFGYNATVRICQSLANRLWAFGGKQNGTQYDQCGIIIPQQPCFAGLFACGANLAVPSQTYGSVEEWMTSAALAPPESPFVDDRVTLVVVPDNDPEGCYAGSDAARAVPPLARLAFVLLALAAAALVGL
jgi:hypothetical protein